MHKVPFWRSRFFNKVFFRFIFYWHMAALFSLSILPLIFGVPRMIVPIPVVLWPIQEVIFNALIVLPGSFFFRVPRCLDKSNESLS